VAGELELRLARATTVTGRVVGPGGEPIVGARLVACAPRADGVPERVLGPVTGADGRFTFDWCPVPPRGSDASVVIAAQHRGFAWSAGVELRPDQGDVTLGLGALRTIAGTVKRASGTASPHPGVVAEFVPAGMTKFQAATMGVRWRYAARGAADGSYELAGARASAGTLEFQVDGATFERALSADGDLREDLVLEEGLAIAGRIVDVDGEPVTAGGILTVSVLNHPQFSTLRRSVDVSDDGTFRVVDLPSGLYGVSARVPTYDVGGAVVQAGAENVELVAERPASLIFELVYPEDAERIPVVVLLHNAADAAARTRTVRIVPGGESAEGAIELVRRGTYHITAQGGAFRASLRDVVVPDGARPPMRLVLERTLVRTLKLEDRDGTPLVGRRVRVSQLSGQGGRPETFFTGEDGKTQISGLSAGDWQARVIDVGKPMTEIRFTVGGETGGGEIGDDIVLRVPPHGTLVVGFDRETGNTAGGIVSMEMVGRPALHGWVEGARGLAARFRVPPEGDLVIRGVPAHEIEVVLHGSTGELARVAVRVQDGKDVSVRFP